MSHKPELPVEVVTQIEKEAEAHNTRLKEHAESEKDEAYAQGFAEGWGEGATTYATKLIECDRANSALEEKARALEEENEELKRQSDKLKEQATGWRPLLEKVLHRHEGGLLPDRFLYLEIKKFLYGE